MNINYERAKTNHNKYISLDKNKKNILIIGPASNDIERLNIINPVTLDNALALYGESDLYEAYKNAFEITNDFNIYTSNCFTTTDYLSLADNIIQYDFDYLVPIGIYLTDTFYNPLTKTNEFYTNYILNILYEANSLTTLIMTEKHASLYDDIDYYLQDMKDKYKKYTNNNNSNKLSQVYGSNLITTLNMLKDIPFSNVILSSLLSINNSKEYLNGIDPIPVFDLDKNDINNLNYVYFKYNYSLKLTFPEKLLNFRYKADIYKNILINELIKTVIKILDLNEYKGKLYTTYIKLQIATKIKNLLKPYINNLFKSYELKNIGFIKTNPGCGYIYIELSVVPYGLIDNINIVLEV